MKRPNFLLIFPDQHRGDWTELNNNLPIRTPNIKKMVESGVSFSSAICPSPLCSPSRSCLASGRQYDNCNIIGNQNCHPLEETSFYSLLKDSGYHTMACGKFDLNKPLHSYGKDGQQIIDGKSYLPLWGFSDGIDNAGKHDGVRTYIKWKDKIGPYLYYLEKKGLAKVHVKDFMRRRYSTIRPTKLSDEDYADNWIGNNALKLLEKVPNEKPWFLQVNFNGPHEPMDVTKSMREQWKDVKFPDANCCNRFSKKKIQGIRQNYSAMVENIDRWVGIFIEKLKQRGELENTIIIYSSDHGEMLGDHNRTGKAVPFQPSINVPLIISGKNIINKNTINTPVSTIDIAGTILDYASINIPDYMDCISLRGFLEGKEELSRKYIHSGLYTWRVVLKDQYKLIVGFSNAISSKMKKQNKKIKTIHKNPIILYNLQEDPYERNNIAQDYPDLVHEMLSNI